MSIPPFDSTAYSTYTQPPNPSWTYGQKIDSTPAGRAWLAGESAGWKVYDTAETDKTELYKLLISGIVPRPIAFVSTITDEGVTNNPPIISFACNHSAPGRLKDTAANLKNSQGFTVNIISEPFVENANATAIDAPPGFDEWSISGLTKEKCVQIKASRLYKSIDITHPVTGEQSSTLILAHVKYIHVRKDVLTDRGVIDLTKFRPVARLGDISYARVGDAYRLARPTWAQEETKIQDALATLASL
ncbi:hypothetical protein DEU56DRAFT_842592 [Suillus clintonianus]|uniref:uncharacterized protein n=1 Tax=Suillus clintonianus TaxID=1904413 RepID=UPI001B8642BD|nr:uncharacterized protein DEU56DRAFT_842592 [Suillus clintonianus]KAG2112512.1 hypothetical protein DEU56DRAFT_842592 [Suillus clintonianus]